MTMSFILNLAGWVFFILAVANFLAFGSTDRDIAMGIVMDFFNLPDFKTIIFAGSAAFLGYQAHLFGKRRGEAKKRGVRVMVSSIVCIVLSFSPLASPISLLSYMAQRAIRSVTPDGVESVPENEYTLYSFLGDGYSLPFDEDILNYTIDKYDGHARDTYSEYRVCGQIFNRSGEWWHKVVLEFALVDKEGNDLLDKKGNPIILRTGKDSRTTRLKNFNNELTYFVTNTVKAKDLPEHPYGIRLFDIRRNYYINPDDGTRHPDWSYSWIDINTEG